MPEAASTAFQSLAAQCTAHTLSCRGGLNRRALDRTLDFIHRHLGDPITLSDLARAAAISRFHFARLFRVNTGDSPMAYVLRLRIEHARQLLASGGHAIVDIAATLGFFDQSHFTRTFRRLVGVSPRQYVQQLQATRPRPGPLQSAGQWQVAPAHPAARLHGSGNHPSPAPGLESR